MTDYNANDGGTPVDTPQAGQAPTPPPAPETPQYTQQTPPPAPSSYSEEGRGMAIASLVLGIASCAFAWFLSFITIFTSVAGLILAILARKKHKSGISTAGLVLSIIGIVLSVIWLIIWIIALGAAASYGY